MDYGAVGVPQRLEGRAGISIREWTRHRVEMHMDKGRGSEGGTAGNVVVSFVAESSCLGEYATAWIRHCHVHGMDYLR